MTTTETFAIRTSERGTLKRCPQKWYWSQVDGLEPLRIANPLWFGQGVHVALADWYLPGSARGPHPAQTFERWVDKDRNMRIRSAHEDDELDWVSAKDLGIDMLENYIKDYGKDDEWDVIATEQTFSMWFYRKAPNGRRVRWFKYVGTWDGVYRNRRTREIWLMEHKTAAGLSTAHLPLDDQAGTYQTMANLILRKKGILAPGERIAGVMYNIIRKQTQDTRPVNADGLHCNKPNKKHYLAALAGVPEVREAMKIEDLAVIANREGVRVLGDPSERQPGSYRHREEVYRSIAMERTILRRIKDEARYIEAYRNHDPRYPLLKVPSQFGSLPCSSCPFFRMCVLHETGDMESVEDFKASMFRVRDPYGEHDLKAA